MVLDHTHDGTVLEKEEHRTARQMPSIAEERRTTEGALPLLPMAAVAGAGGRKGRVFESSPAPAAWHTSLHCAAEKLPAASGAHCGAFGLVRSQRYRGPSVL
jgi:hypothetical protein